MTDSDPVLDMTPNPFQPKAVKPKVNPEDDYEFDLFCAMVRAERVAEEYERNFRNWNGAKFL